MKKAKRILATFLVVLTLLTSAPLSGLVNFDWSSFKVELPKINIDWDKINPFATKSSAIIDTSNYPQWSTFEFGEYPQSKVYSTSIISSLNSITPTNGVYELNKNRYVKVGSDYYIFEPLVWRVAYHGKDNTCVVMTDHVIDSRIFNSTSSDLSWKNSSIRSWLNGSFYDMAFSDSEKNYILTSNLDNSAASNYTSYSTADTEDKIYLFSHGDLTNRAYNFSSNDRDDDAQRRSTPTEYAKAVGASRIDNGYCSYWTRSCSSSVTMYVLSSDGCVGTCHNPVSAYSTGYGVRPVCRINSSLLTINTESDSYYVDHGQLKTESGTGKVVDGIDVTFTLNNAGYEEFSTGKLTAKIVVDYENDDHSQVWIERSDSFQIANVQKGQTAYIQKIGKTKTEFGLGSSFDGKKYHFDYKDLFKHTYDKDNILRIKIDILGSNGTRLISAEKEIKYSYVDDNDYYDNNSFYGGTGMYYWHDILDDYNNTEYNHNIATLCSQFALIGYDAEEGKNRMIDKLRAIGFIGESGNMDFHTGSDPVEGRKKVNYFIGVKKSKLSDGKIYNVVFMGTIGSNKYQWYDNFDPLGTYKDKINNAWGDTDTNSLKLNHNGFNNAKMFAYNKLTEFLDKYGCTKADTKIILTGHSRGAATANLLSAKLIDEESVIKKDNVYAYTFATPNNTSSDNVESDKYKCIFNIVNPEDFVTHVMLKSWQFKKYGRTYVLPSRTNISSYDYYLKQMNKVHKKITSSDKDADYEPYGKGEYTTYNIINLMSAYIGGTGNFYSDKYNCWLDKYKSSYSAYDFFQKTLLPYVSGVDEKTAQVNMVKVLVAEVLYIYQYYFSVMGKDVSTVWKNIWDTISFWDGNNNNKRIEEFNKYIVDGFYQLRDDTLYSDIIGYFICPDFDGDELLQLIMNIFNAFAKAVWSTQKAVVFKDGMYALMALFDDIEFVNVFIDNLKGVIDVVGLGGRFAQAHEMETYCSYMMSLYSDQVTCSKSSKYGEWNCPVDIEIIDNNTNEVVGRIVNNTVDETIAAKDNSVVMVVKGDTKSYWLPSDGDYTVKVTGNDIGKADFVSYSIDSCGGETYRATYKDISVNTATEMSMSYGEDQLIEVVELENKDGTVIEPDTVFTDVESAECSVNITVDGDAIVDGPSKATIGDYITLVATACCNEFVGWYNGTELVSNEASYKFRVDGDVNLTAKFTSANHEYTQHVVAPTCNEDGYTMYSCANCINSYVDNETKASGHKYGKYISNGDATCVVDGTKTATCSVCGIMDTVADTGSKTGVHDYEENWNVNDYTDVSLVLKCKNCTVEQTVKASVTSKVTSKATCLTYGVNTYTAVAAYNGKEYKTVMEQQTPKSTTHTYSASWTYDSYATTSSYGSKSHQCSVCGDKKDITSIPRIYSCTLSNTEYYADGTTARTPSVTVLDYYDKVLKKGTDYTVTYSSTTRKDPGTYYVTIDFKGDYSGSRTLYYYLYSTVYSLRKTDSTFTGLSLSWNKLAGVTGYNIYRKLSTDTAYKKIGTTKSLTYTDSKASVNKEYYYVVRPYNSVKEGTDSSSVYLSTKVNVPSISVSNDTTGTLSIYTSRSSNTNGYELYRATSETGKFTTIKSSAYSYYYDSGLTVGKTYYYKARSFSIINGKKYYSDYTDVRGATVNVQTPNSPTVYPNNDISLYVKWNAVPGATGYDIYRCDSSYGSYIRVGTTTNTYYTSKSLQPGYRYYFKIVAYKTVGKENIYSNMSGYDYDTTRFGYPYDVEVTNSSLTTNKVTWKIPSGAKGVELSISVGNSYDYKVIGEYTTTSYTHKNLEPSTTYYYKLRAYKTVSGEKVYSDYYTTSYRALIPQVTGLKATSTSKSSIKLTWTKVKDATIYYIYSSSSINGSYYYEGSTESNSYELTDLALDRRMYFKVEARRNVNGYTNYGIYSEPVGKIVVTPTPSISSISNPNSTSLKITWKKVAEATSYTLYRSTSKTGTYTAVKSGLTTTTYTDTKLKNGTTYYYKVKAVSVADGVENISAYSAVSSKKVALISPAVTATPKSLTSVKLSWTKDTYVTGYEIYRSTSADGTYTKIATISKADTQSYTSSKLTAGKTYYYKMRAYKTVSGKTTYSSYTKVVSVKVSLAQVTGLKSSSEATTSLKLTWTKVTGAKYYKVEQSTDGKKWTVIAKANTADSLTVSKLTAGTKYQFRVTAIDSSKKYTGKVSAVLKTGTLTSAPSIKLTSTTAKTATATWSKITGASKYTVYKSTDNKTWTKVADTTKLTYNITGLTGGKVIYVKAVAVNAYGKASAYSSVKNITVKK